MLTLDSPTKLYGSHLVFTHMMQAVNNLEATFKEHNIPIEIHRYEGVGHAFTNADRKTYDEKAAAEAYAKVFAFFHKHLDA